MTLQLVENEIETLHRNKVQAIRLRAIAWAGVNNLDEITDWENAERRETDERYKVEQTKFSEKKIYLLVDFLYTC